MQVVAEEPEVMQETQLEARVTFMTVVHAPSFLVVDRLHDRTICGNIKVPNKYSVGTLQILLVHATSSVDLRKAHRGRRQVFDPRNHPHSPHERFL